MNQKDYKAIAEIINKHFKLNISDVVIYDLADYFEREDKELLLMSTEKAEDWDKIVKENPAMRLSLKFNREQFLKDCGVKE